jgi:hypothetical protein
MGQSPLVVGLSQEKRAPIDNAAAILASTDIRRRRLISCVWDAVAHALFRG